jgi:hypothetical protein
MIVMVFINKNLVSYQNLRSRNVTTVFYPHGVVVGCHQRIDLDQRPARELPECGCYLGFDHSPAFVDAENNVAFCQRLNWDRSR